MEATIVIIILLLIGGLFGSLYLLFGRGRKVDYNPEGFSPDLTLSPEEEAETLETEFEVLKVEKAQDEEFENNVTKIKEETSLMSPIDLADDINSFYGVNVESRADIVVTDDKSTFDWENSPSKE
jgi:predicted nucleic acid-binding protein